MAVDLPWDCTLPGVPASLQGSGHKRADWRQRVSAAAARRWPGDELPLEGPLALLVAFLHFGQPIDVDNMLKPTLDGLIGVCYVDDAQLEQLIGVRWDLSRTLRLEWLSPVLMRAVVAAVADGGPFVYLRLTPAGRTRGDAALNGSKTSTVRERQAVENLVKRLQAEGWTVLVQPNSAHLPEALAPFRPELVAHRGDEHLIAEIKSRRTPPDLDMVTLAEQVAALPGWRLDLAYVPEEPAAADPEQLLRWAATAESLAASAPEAALLLAWAAVEGLMHQLAEARGVDSELPGRLLATLATLGIVEHAEHELLRRAMQTRNALAHGRRTAKVDSATVQHLTDLAKTLARRASPAFDH